MEVFLVLVCGTRGKNVLALFIYTLYIVGKNPAKIVCPKSEQYNNAVT
jgi:hypothetical protein